MVGSASSSRERCCFYINRSKLVETGHKDLGARHREFGNKPPPLGGLSVLSRPSPSHYLRLATLVTLVLGVFPGLSHFFQTFLLDHITTPIQSTTQDKGENGAFFFFTDVPTQGTKINTPTHRQEIARPNTMVPTLYKENPPLK